MKFIKFEKILVSENPIVRITYKNFWGKTMTRDARRCVLEEYWDFMDNDEVIYKSKSINTFYESDYDVFSINKTLKK